MREPRDDGRVKAPPHFHDTPPDPALVRLVEALARAQARRDHRADLAARQPHQDQPHAPRSPVQPVQL